MVVVFYSKRLCDFNWNFECCRWIASLRGEGNTPKNKVMLRFLLKKNWICSWREGHNQALRHTAHVCDWRKRERERGRGASGFCAERLPACVCTTNALGVRHQHVDSMLFYRWRNKCTGWIELNRWIGGEGTRAGEEYRAFVFVAVVKLITLKKLTGRSLVTLS